MQAWLRLIPKGGTQTNGSMYGDELPDIPDNVCHLPEFLSRIGTVCQTGVGLAPLNYQEIEAWARMSNLKIGHFEAYALRSMSAVYCSIASDPDSPCPIHTEEATDAISAVNVSSWMAYSKHD